MIPDFEKINERMEQGFLNELVPGFDREQEWQKLHAKLHRPKKTQTIWAYAAAVILLFIGGAWAVIHLSNAHQQSLAVYRASSGNLDSSVYKIANAGALNYAPQIQAKDQKQSAKSIVVASFVTIKKAGTGHKLYTPAAHSSAKNIICNGTPCPIEICINQTMRCPNIEPATISSCSTLEPDQSGRLTYKAHDKIAKNCSLTVNEIEIKNIATGETILLTETSTPSTAQDVFSYITGQRKGDVQAGIFNSDCGHTTTQKHDLRIDNSYGDLILQ